MIMAKMKIKLTTLFCTTLICGAFIVTNSAVAKDNSKSTQEAAIPPAMVETATVQYSTVFDQLTATGTLVAIPGVVVKPEISGRITNVYFKSGDEVKAGTPLIEIYPDIMKAQLLQSQAELKLNKLNFDRYAKLYTTRTVSKADYDQAKAAFESSVAKVAQSQASLNQTLIKAPFDGHLGVNLISIGQYISVGQDIVSLESLDPIYVDFTVPEIYTSKVAINQLVKIKSDAYPDDKFQGKIVAIDPLVSQAARSLKVRAEIANKDKKLLPGSFADVVVFVGAAQQVIKVPQTAITYDSNGNYVYRVVANKAVKTLVTLGARDNQNIVVKRGLKVGDTIVTAGQLKISQDGTPVVIVSKHVAKKS